MSQKDTTVYRIVIQSAWNLPHYRIYPINIQELLLYIETFNRYEIEYRIFYHIQNEMNYYLCDYDVKELENCK